jgi:hypothetical protein
MEAARAAAEVAVEAAVPLAVQAAVAEERGRAAERQALDKAVFESFRSQVHSWRAAALVTSGMSAGAVAGSWRAALCGAAGGAVAAIVWLGVEHWLWKAGAMLSP